MSNYADYVKGKGLVLITGKKGSGKSHFVTKIIKDLRDKYPDHKVYADITGLKIEGVELSPDDWHDVPNNCTIIYDEIQLKAWADNSNTKINSDARVKDMTLIRKQNKNIVLITQDPMFIHSALRKLVDYHYHLSHPFKDGRPKVFYFAGAMDTIDAKGAYQAHALETFTHVLDKETSALYDSIDPDAKHDQKRKIPKRILYMIGFIVFLVLVGIPAGVWGLSKVAGFIFGADERSNQQMAESKQSVNQASAQQAITGGVTAAVGSAPVVDPTQQALLEQKKLHEKYLTAYTVEVANDDAVRPQAFMMMHGKCTAYNMFGDGLMLSQKDCIAMLKNPALRPHRRQLENNNNNYGQYATQMPVASAPVVAKIPVYESVASVAKS